MARVFINDVLQTDGAYRYTLTESENSTDFTLPFTSKNMAAVTANNKLYIVDKSSAAAYLYELDGTHWTISGRNIRGNAESCYGVILYKNLICNVDIETIWTGGSSSTISSYWVSFRMVNVNDLANTNTDYTDGNGDRYAYNKVTVAFDKTETFFTGGYSSANIKCIACGDKIHIFNGSSSKHIAISFDVEDDGSVCVWENGSNPIVKTVYTAPTTPNNTAITFSNCHFVVYNNHIRVIFKDKYLDYNDSTNTWTQSSRSAVGTGTDSDFANQVVFMDSQGREHQVGTFADANNHIGYDYVYDPSTGYNDTLYAQLPINNNFAAVGETDGNFYYMGGTTTYGGTTASNQCYKLSSTAKQNSYYQPNEFENSVKLYTLVKEAIS